MDGKNMKRERIKEFYEEYTKEFDGMHLATFRLGDNWIPILPHQDIPSPILLINYKDLKTVTEELEIFMNRVETFWKAAASVLPVETEKQ